MRPPVGPQRDRFGIGDQVADRQRQRGVDNLGQPLGDVVEAAGVDRDLVTRAMDLYPGAVELRIENRCAAQAFERVGDAGGGLGKHRAHRPPDPQGELLQCRLPAGQRRGRHRRQITGEHRSAPHRRGGNAGGLGHRVGHHADQGALAQFPAEQASQESLLGLGGRAEQSGDQFGAARL